VLVSTFAPKLNGQGLGVAASADGTRIYVTGEFTTVNGVARSRIAALNATTGALVTTWHPTLNYRARPIVVAGDNVYVGGQFTVANSQPRARVAAFSAATGALLPLRADANDEVFALAYPGASHRLVVGGRFTTVNGSAQYGLAAVDYLTGAVKPMPANQVVRNAGPNAAIYSLSSDRTRVYGTGYSFGTGGNFEGTFQADAATGQLGWVNGCLGDTYSAFPVGPVLYSVSHAHNCAAIKFFPESKPRAFQRGMASMVLPSATGLTNQTGPFLGKPAADPLHWLPTLDGGTVTGQDQAAWTVTAGGPYVLLGGEFPRVNGKAQQGLARFATSAVAPNKEGPRGAAGLTPTATGVSRGTVKVAWTSTWDRDNRSLTYEVIRNSAVIATIAGDSAWWSLPQLSYTDSTATPGSTASYRIRVRDAFGNVVSNPSTTVVVPS
jgi:hypothetical protein